MALNLGLVGLPGSGKTTLFKALVRGKARISAHRHGGLEPNLGNVPVPDERLESLKQVIGSESIVPLSINFIDLTIPRSSGTRREDLGKQVIAHLREADALVVILRGFIDSTGILPEPDPVEDAKILGMEMMLADLELVESLLSRREKAYKLGQKEFAREVEILKKVHSNLQRIFRLP